MRTLLVMRHGKSDWDAPSGSDHQRSLAPRGIKAARRMGRFLTTLEEVPDLVLSSSAERARSTAELVIEAGGWGSPLEVRDRLYLADASAVVDEVTGVGGGVERLLVVGHEPTCSALVAALVGGGALRFPTAAVAVVGLAIDSWAELVPGCGELHLLVVPRALARLDAR